MIDNLFLWVKKEVKAEDLASFFAAYTDGDIGDSVPHSPDIIKAVKMAKDAGAKLSDINDMYDATVHFANKLMAEAKEADEKAVIMRRLEEAKKKADEETRKKAEEEAKPLKAWQKVITKEDTPVVEDANTSEELDLGSEDLRKWKKIDIEELVTDLVDSAHKRHNLNFKLRSEKTRDKIDYFMARITKSNEPITQNMIARWVDTSYKKVSDSAHAEETVRRDLNGIRVKDEIFALLKEMAKDGTYSQEIAKHAIQLNEENVDLEDVEAILDRTVNWKGDFMRAYKKVLGTDPVAVVKTTALEAKKPVVETAPPKAKKPWER